VLPIPGMSAGRTVTLRSLIYDHCGGIRAGHRLKAVVPGGSSAPILTAARRDATGAVTLTWRAGRGTPATGFAVYRVDETAPASGATDSNASLVATSRSTGEGEQTWVDRTAASGGSYAYCVTAVDRVWNEGVASAPRRVR